MTLCRLGDRAALRQAGPGIEGGRTPPRPTIAVMIPLSVLDLAPIVAGSDAATALRHSVDLARHAEAWGYRRDWLAEHHNMDGVASAPTSALVGHATRLPSHELLAGLRA
jgi:hypothetical protein